MRCIILCALVLSAAALKFNNPEFTEEDGDKDDPAQITFYSEETDKTDSCVLANIENIYTVEMHGLHKGERPKSGSCYRLEKWTVTAATGKKLAMIARHLCQHWHQVDL